jgi:hypothetical protein
MMNRRAFLMAGAASGLAPALFPAGAEAEALNYDALALLRQVGLAEEASEVMSTASYLMDVLGPRLSGSPGWRKSADWVVQKLKGWGIGNAGLEAWPNDPTGSNNGFPRGWANEKFYFAATSPNAFPIAGMSIAWTPGTKGLVSGECVVIGDMEDGELRRAFSGKLRGKWVLGQAPIEMRAEWDPLARRLSQADLDLLETPARPVENGSPSGASPATPSGPIGQQLINRNAFYFEQGALGVISTNKGHGTVNITGGGRGDGSDTLLPRIAIEAEHYGRIARSVLLGQPVVIEADIRNAWYDNPEMFNIVAEIPGREQPDEVVIIGGHFDSFHAATGATDNGGACACLMEAMRLLTLTKAPLKRTVRLCLWNGEEQGLIGSRLYVAQHFGGVRGAPTPGYDRGEVVAIKRAHSRFQAYFNLDNGAGSIRGVHNQGNKAIVPVFRQWMEPLRDLGVSAVSQRISKATDHASFDDAGLPGFQFIQDPLDYEPTTHHTNMDFFEALQPEDMRRNSVILASFAMMAANHSGFLPRRSRS